MPKMKFGSDEWLKALHDELNRSKSYEEAGKTWEGDLYFVVEPEGPVTEPVYMYIDLWHGKSREVHIAKDKSEKDPAFVISGSYDKWKKVVMAQLDPIQAMMTGQLKLKGNLIMIMKHVKAAQEMVKACTRIDTEFET